MTDEEFIIDKEKHRNKSRLSHVDCLLVLTNKNVSFEEMLEDDLDLIYRVAFDLWAYHLPRQAYIDALNKERIKRNNA